MTDIELATAQAELRAVYRERAHLVAYLAAWFPSTIAYSDPSTPDWPVVTLDTFEGQMCWHIAPDDVELFAHMPPTPDGQAPVWDGHSTEEKYERLARLTAKTAEHYRAQGSQTPQETPAAPKRRGRPRKTAQSAPTAPETPKEA